ncbi:MAG: DUF721 domain-containing protein [Eggerthellaceae bacterium]|nr:DUF721 domain-containing protein [Eggerthellaceae bacterium]
MKKIGNDIQYFVAGLAGDQDQARINMRAFQVRDRYRSVIQTVYRDTADLFLAHTNNVYIMNKDGVRTLIVYVDESIFAAELNAQRELIKLALLQMFGEEVEEFKIFVSRGKYKSNHPFIEENDSGTPVSLKPLSLDENEQDFVENTVETLQAQELKKSFEKAMTASLGLNKAEKGKTS